MLRLANGKFLNGLLWIMLVGFVMPLGASVGGVGVLFHQVWFGDGSQLKKTTIMARINEETTLFCLDEETPIGSFFNSEHRQYTTIDQVPKHMILALVAAEDKNFFEHKGIDPTAILKAIVEGFQTGKFRGGSTLTQQTVKNILDSWEYSVRRKIREAIAAIQLEKLYSKEQILEFYLNQFHVSGNGSGIGIAAKYYFNKEVRDLDLVESAFIAGSVKGPSKYDPFLKYTKERRELAVKNAFDRKNYVLKRMLEQGWLKAEEYRDAAEKPVPFNRGSFRSSEVALVSLIRSQVTQREVLDQLQIEDAVELNNAGMRVYSTIDCKQQEKAQLAMRRNLSRLETILSGFSPEKPDQYRRLRDLVPNKFYHGKVESIKGSEKNAEIEVTFGLSSGKIPHESLVRYAKLLDLPLMQGWESQLKKLLATIKPGDILFVEVREYDPVKHTAVLELQKNPSVNGGLVSLDKGEVRIAVSGFDTIGFNRAIYARRQPGSVFKSVVYYAAMQLGWNVLDLIDNERQVFPFQGKFYFPRPDHPSPYPSTSMIWSGAMSENLASVALANRLLDKLNFDQFKSLMGVMDLLPKTGEAAPDYHFRVAKATGVQLDNDGIKEYQLQRAVADISPDLVFRGQNEALRYFEKMWYGRGYAAELQRLYSKDASDMPPLENATRVNLIKNNYLRMQRLAENAASEWDSISMKVAELGAEGAMKDPVVVNVLQRFKVLPTRGSNPSLGYLSTLDGEAPQRPSANMTFIDRLATVQGRNLTMLDVEAIWNEGAIKKGDLRLNGTVSLDALTQLKNAMSERYSMVISTATPFDLNRYFEHHDFKLSLGLKYLVAMVKAMGVTSPVDAVQSFPLGTNDVTAAEVAKIYQTFVEGKIYRFYEKGPENQINFIRRIEDRYGNVVFEPKRKEAVVALPEYSVQMQDILKRVVTHGTAKRARGEIYLQLGDVEGAKNDPKKLKELEKQRVRIQSFGKTGTTNDYNNAYFAGFFPVPTVKGAPLDYQNFYSIASYVGYDMNRMMRRGAIKVSGSVGALPTWIDYTKAMMEVLRYADYLNPEDPAVVQRGEWAFKRDEKGSAVFSVDLPRGSIAGSTGADEEVFETTDIARTGESYSNEFAIGNTVRAPVRGPSDGQGGMARYFSPFVFKPDLKESNTPTMIKVDVAPVSAVGSSSPTSNLPGGVPGVPSLLPGANPVEIEKMINEPVDDEGRLIQQDNMTQPDSTPIEGSGNTESQSGAQGDPGKNVAPSPAPKSSDEGDGELW